MHAVYLRWVRAIAKQVSTAVFDMPNQFIINFDLCGIYDMWQYMLYSTLSVSSPFLKPLHEANSII